MISLFIWNNKNGKIARNLVAQDHDMGALKLTHTQSFIKALKIRWMKMFLDNTNSSVSVFRTLLKANQCSAVSFLDGKSIRLIGSQIDNTFWVDVPSAWAELIEEGSEPEDVVKYCLWHSWYIRNPNIIHQGPVMRESGVLHIMDLLGQDCKFLSHHDFMQKYNIAINWMDYNSLISSIPKCWKT